LGGLLLGIFGLSSVVLVDSTSYLVSGLMMILIRVPAMSSDDMSSDASPAGPDREAVAAWVAVWRAWRDGLRLMRTQQIIATVLLLIGLSYVAEGLALAVFGPYVQGILRVSALQRGWLASASSLGTLGGGLCLGVVSRRVSPLRLIIAAIGALGAVFVLEAAFPVFLLVLGLGFLNGAPIVAVDVSLATLLQSHVPNHYRGRVFGTVETTISLAVLGGMGVGGVLGGLLGVQPVLATAGGINLGVAVWALVVLPSTRGTTVCQKGTDTVPRDESAEMSAQ
jgi:predicted MFS family arabinose efflux permease